MPNNRVSLMVPPSDPAGASLGPDALGLGLLSQMEQAMVATASALNQGVESRLRIGQMELQMASERVRLQQGVAELDLKRDELNLRSQQIADDLAFRKQQHQDAQRILEKSTELKNAEGALQVAKAQLDLTTATLNARKDAMDRMEVADSRNRIGMIYNLNRVGKLSQSQATAMLSELQQRMTLSADPPKQAVDELNLFRKKWDDRPVVLSNGKPLILPKISVTPDSKNVSTTRRLPFSPDDSSFSAQNAPSVFYVGGPVTVGKLTELLKNPAITDQLREAVTTSYGATNEKDAAGAAHDWNYMMHSVSIAPFVETLTGVPNEPVAPASAKDAQDFIVRATKKPDATAPQATSLPAQTRMNPAAGL